jgi:peroxiredoxin
VGAQSTASRAARWRLDPAFVPAPSQPHPLLGEPAPEFELPDSQKRPRSLAATRALGPVVLVFYYGFQCSHCVAQLYQVDYDYGEFDKLGVQVLALCADSPEHSNRQMSRHGRFGFPLLSDADNRVASLYGVFTPATGERDEDLQHGTFVIDRDGRVVWAQRGYEPFTDNATLLKVIAGLEAPAPQTE